MSDPRTQAALGRISAALDRIDAASARSSVSPDNGQLAELEARHGRLRQEVGSALHALDSFIQQNQGTVS